ncbi:hypothetical protein CHU92_10365 [Flavobacterium cyanobacteriorum]|uniref:Secretion system C-terminal sorting domain-containing protein n=1 Tax=Flavobacterium cyanobacteriorum TaxID=2022802 RepID=A0A255Z4A6_9FLAO|nr:T9SS type A sorting domain-containing protein [Flavobacterium cyanobacteriorum]OYQ35754.1 hypothetical protein CHU92_10365 [Flavobacterium cyanobacteriorum]
MSGLISLILSVKPNLTVAQVRQVLEQSSQDLVGIPAEDTPGWDQYYGFGRINAFNALNNALLSSGNNLQAENIAIYPNPLVENSFSISGLIPNLPYDIEIVSIEGRSLKKLYNATANDVLNVEGFSIASGIYFVTIYDKSNQKVFKKKIIKK